jgi:hypothetical protein
MKTVIEAIPRCEPHIHWTFLDPSRMPIPERAVGIVRKGALSGACQSVGAGDPLTLFLLAQYRFGGHVAS